MTEANAKIWLKMYNESIPALDVHKQLACETLEDPDKNLADLADVITLDPGMSVSIYQQVNSRLVLEGKPPVESVQDAIAELGTAATIDWVTQFVTLSGKIRDKSLHSAYHQLMSRIYHLLAQLDQFISIQGIRRVNETRSAALLHNIGEVYACLYDHSEYRRYQANFHRLGADVSSARSIFGFSFRELGRVICREMHLPPLAMETLEESLKSDRRVRVIQFAADISHQAEEGWYHPAMRATLDTCADYLNQSLAGFEHQVAQTAIDSARSCPIVGVLSAAARLIMLPDVEAPARIEPETSMPDGNLDYKDRLRNLFAHGKATEVAVIDLLLNHLDNDLHMSRAVFLQLSQDGTRLGTRASSGLRKFSLVHGLIIDPITNRLFGSLLRTPLGLWVKPSNYHRYRALLPLEFRNSILSEDFFMMALFAGSRPIGMVFCDRTRSISDLDKDTYIRFKAASLMTCRALDHIARNAAK